MANTAHQAIWTVKINDMIQDIFPETKAEMVTLNDGTKLSAKLVEIATSLDGKVTTEALAETLKGYVKTEAGKGLSAEDFTTAFKAKLEGIAAGAQVNVIESVKVNGVAQAISDKAVDIKMPTKVSELSNDSNFQTEAQVNAKISSVYKPGGSVAFASLPAADEASLGMVYNVTDAFATDAKFVEGAGQSYPAGTNVVVVKQGDAYKYDVLAGFVDLTDYAKRSEIPTGKLAAKDTVEESDLAAALAKKITDADTAKHTHANKATLDKIDADKLTALESKARIFVSKEQPKDMTENDLWLRLTD